MSASVGAEASPTIPSHKMNGGPTARHHLNVSALSVPKHSSSVPTMGNVTLSSTPGKPLLDISRTSLHQSLNLSRRTLASPRTSAGTDDQGCSEEQGIYQMLASLALLCLLSLLMSFLALFFLQRVGPVPTGNDKNTNGGTQKIVMSREEYWTVYQVSVALSTLTISLDLCCLFVCCIQFLFAIKLLKTPQGAERTNKFLKRSSYTRVIAIGGFFLSIPIFFTGVILFTFIHFNEIPAFITSVVIGLGIVFCGVASVQNVYLWQWEKTRASRDLMESHLSHIRDAGADATVQTMELSTLV